MHTCFGKMSPNVVAYTTEMRRRYALRMFWENFTQYDTPHCLVLSSQRYSEQEGNHKVLFYGNFWL